MSFGYFQSHAEVRDRFPNREATRRWTGGGAVLHGDATEVHGLKIFGLGYAVPVTPFGDWSWDLPEHEAADLLESCPENAVLVSHSPPFGTADTARGQHLGGFRIACGEDAVEIIEAQRQGKRAMSADELLRGQPLPDRLT